MSSRSRTRTTHRRLLAFLLAVLGRSSVSGVFSPVPPDEGTGRESCTREPLASPPGRVAESRLHDARGVGRPRRAVQHSPKGADKGRVNTSSMYSDRPQVATMLKAWGLPGYVLKDCASGALVDGVGAVANGHTHLGFGCYWNGPCHRNLYVIALKGKKMSLWQRRKRSWQSVGLTAVRHDKLLNLRVISFYPKRCRIWGNVAYSMTYEWRPA